MRQPGQEARLAVNVPLGDMFAARASVLYKSYDGYNRNVWRNEDVGDNEVVAGRLTLVAKPTDNFDATLVADIDRFKSINDQNGHNVGDPAIVHVAKLLGRTLRRSDLRARVGGDEFMVLMPETDSLQATKLADRPPYPVLRNPTVH